MRSLLLINSILLYAFTSFGQKACIQGHWRRIASGIKNISQIKEGYREGDLIIASDTSFILVGNETKTGSDIPGWHAGETKKGRWSMQEGKKIEFVLDNGSLLQVYKIKRLTNKELYLISYFKGARVLKYKRM